jgi:tryptophan-rich sensory protein
MIRSEQRQMVGFIAWLAICFVAAAIGAVASVQARPFYLSLARPAWAPPASVFGPVWTALYASMAIAAWMVWREGGFRYARAALTLFLAQLALNGLWSWLFFAWRLGAAAFVDVLLLWTLIVATLIAFWRIRPLAGAVLIPYLLWVSFAAALNYTVWQLNPTMLGG